MFLLGTLVAIESASWVVPVIPRILTTLRASPVDMVDHGAVLDPPDQQPLVFCGFRCGHWSTCMSIAILTGTPFFDCSK